MMNQARAFSRSRSGRTRGLGDALRLFGATPEHFLRFGNGRTRQAAICGRMEFSIPQNNWSRIGVHLE